jgi:hypothetical protein
MPYIYVDEVLTDTGAYSCSLQYVRRTLNRTADCTSLGLFLLHPILDYHLAACTLTFLVNFSSELLLQWKALGDDSTINGKPPSKREAMGLVMVPGAGKGGRLVIFGGAGSRAGIDTWKQALMAYLQVLCTLYIRLQTVSRLANIWGQGGTVLTWETDLIYSTSSLFSFSAFSFTSLNDLRSCSTILIHFSRFAQLFLAADLLDDLHFLDLFESQWTELKPGLVFGPPPSPRIYSELAGGAGSGGKIYVLGGNVPADDASSDVTAITDCEQCARVTKHNNLFTTRTSIYQVDSSVFCTFDPQAPCTFDPQAPNLTQNLAVTSNDLFEFDTGLLRWRQIKFQNQTQEPWPSSPWSYTTRLIATNDYLYTIQGKLEGLKPFIKIYLEGHSAKECRNEAKPLGH